MRRFLLGRLWFALLCGLSTLGYSQVLINEDFSTATGITPPAGWTNVDNAGNGEVWEFNNPGTRSLKAPISSPAAIFDSDNYGSNGTAEDADLVSPTFDASSVTGSVLLTYDQYFRGGAGGAFDVEVFNGTSWTSVLSGTTSSADPSAVSIDITAAAGGSTVAQVRFNWTGDYSWYWILDNIKVEGISCLAPSALGAINILNTSADLHWTSGGASNWNVEYGPVGFAQGTGTLLSANNDTVNITGLTASTTYDFYVRDSCGAGNVSSWAGPFTFNTACAPNATFPWVQDFEGSQSTIPQCWVNETNDDADWIFRSGSIGHGSTGDHTTGSGYYAGMDDSQNNANDTVNNLLTPLLDLSGLTNPELSLWYFIGNDNILTSKMYIDVYDGTNWNMAVDTVEYTQTAWLPFFMDLTPYKSASSRIRFRGIETTDFNSDLSIDDVTVQEAPSCADPFNLGAFNISDITADVFWTDPGSATSWTVEYGPTGFAQGTGATAVTSNDTTTLSGLNSGSCYDYYVMADCGANGTSSWVGPFNFCTALCPLADQCNYTLKLHDSFGDGWNGTEVTVYQNGVAVTVIGSSFTSSAGSPPGDTLQLTVGLCDSSDIYFIVSQGSNGAPNYTNEIGLDVIDPFGATKLQYDNNSAADQGDTIGMITTNCTAPACGDPLNPGVTNITPSGATIYWTDIVGSAISWNVEYGPTGFMQGTGTAFTASNDTTSLSGLSPQTTYDVYVQSDCGTNGTSAYVGPLTFTTACGPLLPPQLEDFNSGFPPTICWDQAASGTPTTGPSGLGSSDWGAEDFANTASGTGAVRINLWDTGTEDWVLSPRYDLAAGGPFQVEFDFGVFDFLSSTPSTLGSDDEVQILVSNDNGATWTALRVFDNTHVTPGVAGSHEIIDLTAYSGDTVQFGIWGTEGTTDDPEDNDIFVDNFEVRAIPACLEPSSLGTFSITDTSAELYWTGGGGATDWNIEYGPVGFARGTGIMVNSTNDTLLISGLMAGTTYEFYVRDSCAVGNTSIWKGPEEFTTAVCPINKQCAYTFILHDAFGDGWNGTEVTVYQDNVPVAVVGPGFDANAGSPAGDTLVLTLNLCDSLDTYFAITNGSNGSPNWSEEIGLEVIHPYGVQALNYDNSAAANLGDTLGMFSTSCTAPSCLPPSAGGVDVVTSTSADIFWTGGGASFWNIEYGTAGFMQGAGTLAISSNDTTTLSGLNPATTYEFYVRDSCGAGDVSTWSGPYTFTTACAALASFPWVEDFETSQNVIPQCWENEANDDADWIFRSGSIGHGATGDHTTGSGYYAGMDDSQNNANDTINNLLTPFFDLTTLANPQLSFWYFIGNDNVLTSMMYIDVYDGTSWNMAVDTVVYSQVAWLKDSLNLTPYISANTRIRFRGIETTDFNSDLSIDDVVIDDVQLPCASPGNLAAGSITCDQASISWTAGSTSTQSSVVEYGTTNFTLGGGTIVGTTSLTIGLNGLQPGTSYDFYVADVCTSGDTSAFTGPFTFTTASGPIAADFTFSLGTATATQLTVSFDASNSTGATSYSWSFGDGTSGSGMNVTHDYTKDSTYWAVLTVTGPCGTATFGDSIVIQGVSLPEMALANTYAIYPNPTNGMVYIENEGAGTKELQVEVYSLNGKLLLQQNFSGNDRVELDLGQLARGMYNLKLTSDNGAYVRQLVRQ